MNPNVIKITEKSKNRRCDFCHKNEINEVEWGDMFYLEGITVHYFCMLFSSGLVQTGEDTEGIQGFMPSDLKKELRRGEKLKCKYCKGNRATVGCVVKHCKYSFHFTCGLPRGTLHQFVENFVSYCPAHKPDLNIPESLYESECEICFSTVSANEHSVWPPCCKKRIFHRLCMQKYAWKSGLHHFSCPACKSKDPFLDAMQSSGVYVPEQDAEWEAERMFADLEQVYSHCDAEDCLCPRGREYNGADEENKDKRDCKNWKIVRCGICGAKATHYSCSQLKKYSWKCTDCITVITRAPTMYEKDFTDESSSCSDDTSGGDDDDDEDNFNQTNENCRLVIAGRSSLVGLERSTDELCNPADYISHPQSQEVGADKGKIIYNRAFKKKYKVVIDNEISESEDEDDAPVFSRGSLLGVLSCTSDKLHSVDNSQVRPAEILDSHNKHLNSLLRVRNLDLSEHNSQLLAKTCSFPAIEHAQIESETESKSRDDVHSLESIKVKERTEILKVHDESTSSSSSQRYSGSLRSSTRTRSKTSQATESNIPNASNEKKSHSADNRDTALNDVSPTSEVINLVAEKFKEKLEELISSKDNSKGGNAKSTKSNKNGITDSGIGSEHDSLNVPEVEEVEVLKVTKSPKKITEIIDVEKHDSVNLNFKKSFIDTVTLDEDDDDDDLEIVVEKKVRKPVDRDVMIISSRKSSVVKSSALMDILNGEPKRSRGFPWKNCSTSTKANFTNEIVTLSDDETLPNSSLKVTKRNRSAAGLGLSYPPDNVIILSDDEGDDKPGDNQDGHSGNEPKVKKSKGQSSSSCDFGTFQNSSNRRERVLEGSSARGSSRHSITTHREEFTIELKRPSMT